jgi:hypothetical protein
MSQTTATQAPGKTYPAELKEILDRATAGDLAVLPELKRAFDENPELAATLGDLVGHAEMALLTLVAGPCLSVKEAIARQAADLRRRLLASAHSELERLLVDRIVISWLEVYHADIDLTQHLVSRPGGAPATRDAQKRLDAAHRRHLAAVKTFAVVQKLLRPAPSAFDMLSRPVAEKGAGKPAHPDRSRLPAEVMIPN